MKLHLGCGTIYLKDYVNVDIKPDYLTSDAPAGDLVQNTTIFERYYKHDFCKGSGLCIADMEARIDKLPIDACLVEEVVLIQVLEHIPAYEVGNVLKEVHRVLEPGGSFIIGVPDLKETAKLLVEADTSEEEDWCIRLIHGTQRNEYSHHYCGYTKRSLEEILSLYGFGDFEDLENINFYPSIYLKAHKV
jgi:SAM-dependent methyltransferase